MNMTCIVLCWLALSSVECRVLLTRWFGADTGNAILYTTCIGAKQSAHFSHLASLHNTSMNRQSELHALVRHNAHMIRPAVMSSNTAAVQCCTRAAASCSHQVAKLLLSMQSTYEYDSGTEPNLATPAVTLTFFEVFFLVVFIPNKWTVCT